MFHDLALSTFLGIPMVGLGGIITFILLFSTAVIGALNMRGVTKIPLKWHFRLAYVTLAIALVHGFFGLSIALNF